MSKRLTATEKWNDGWFFHLTPIEKLFWLYLLDNCNHAGIWDVNWPLAKLHVGEFEFDASRYKGRIIPIADGTKWFIPKFIFFQYKGELNRENRAHQSVITLLKSEGLWPLPLSSKKEEKSLPLSPEPPQPPKAHPSPIQGATAGAKDKDKDKATDKALELDKATDNVSRTPASISAPALDRTSPGVRRGTAGWYKDGWMVECDICGPIQDETHTRCHYCPHVYDFSKGQNDGNHCCKSS